MPRLAPHDQDFRRIVTQFVDAFETGDPTERAPLQEGPSVRIQSARSQEETPKRAEAQPLRLCGECSNRAGAHVGCGHGGR